MRIKEITVGGSRTINLGNYNSIKVEGSCTVELNTLDDLDGDAVSNARTLATNEVKSQLKEAMTTLSPQQKG